MASPTYVPVINYPAPVDSQHQGPKVTVTVALCLSFAGVVLATRLLIRWPWRRLLGLDDVAAIVATLFALAQWIIVMSAVSQGLGTASDLVSEDDILQTEKMMFAADIFYVLSLFCGKLSVCLFFRRLSASSVRTMIADALTCGCAALAVISLFVVCLRENVMEPWVHGPDLGLSTLHRWIAQETFAILVDLAIVAYPFFLVWGLQMQNGMKMTVLAGFGIRLPLIPLAILRLKSLQVSLTSSEYLFDTATTEYYTQACMSFSLIAATIPCLRIFMEAAKTGLLGISMWEAGTTTGSYGKSYAGRNTGNMSHAKDTVSREHHMTESIQLRDRSEGSNSAQARATSDRNSVNSNGSETAIIVKQTFDVRYD